MRHLLYFFLTVPLLCLTFSSCQSNDSSVSAHTRRRSTVTDARDFKPVILAYEDSTKPAWLPIKARLDSFYRIQARAGFNGSVLIGYKGKILYERYIGVANREQGIPLSPNSANQLASVSKTFTGAAIMMLYEHKYLDINEPVQRYIKEFPYPNITVKMLLDHRSGLADYTHWLGAYTKTPIYNDQLMQLLAAHHPPLDFKPDTRFQYSNTNYATLARIIEMVTEMHYKDFMKHYIFDPLGMTHTFVFDPAEGLPATATISYKYNWAREPVMFADGIYGDKGIYSTVEDMYRWDQSFYQNKLESAATQELAYTPTSFERAGIKNYGLGWRMLCYPNGYKVIYHNGWWHGNNNCFYRFIRDDFTIVVLGNKFSNAIYHQPLALYHLINGGDASGASDEGEE